MQLNLFLILFSFLISNSCFAQKSSNKIAEKKNVILIIADGLGPTQLSFLELLYQKRPELIKQIASKILPADLQKKLTYDAPFYKTNTSFAQGISLTHPFNGVVPDSASSATQLSIGEISLSETIGYNWNGGPGDLLTSFSKKQGYKVGVVSDTRVTHATPAAFLTHAKHRSEEKQMAKSIFNADNFDLVVSGGLNYFNLDCKKITRKNDLESCHSKDTISTKNNFLFSQSNIDDASSKDFPLIFFTHENIAPPVIDRINDNAQLFLPQIALKSIELLSSPNSKGYFLMVEAGQIDWALHENDPGQLIYELIQYDLLVKSILYTTSSNKNTLVVITADHETGGFGLSYSDQEFKKSFEEKYKADKAILGFMPSYNFGDYNELDLLFQHKYSYKGALEKLRLLTSDTSSMRNSFEDYFPYKLTDSFFETLSSALQKKSRPIINEFSSFYVYDEERLTAFIGRNTAQYNHVVWSTGTHTTAPVFNFAYGSTKARTPFIGHYHNSLVGKKIKDFIKSN